MGTRRAVHGACQRRGGTSFETLDPDLKLAYVHELTTRLERELGGGISASTGVIWRGVRQQGVRQHASWSFDAFTIATTRPDPGPAGGTLGPPGEGSGIVVHELPDALIGPSEIVMGNLPRSNSDYLTWEMSADRRFNRRWSLAGSFAHTWNRDHASVYFGQMVRANALPVTPTISYTPMTVGVMSFASGPRNCMRRSKRRGGCG